MYYGITTVGNSLAVPQKLKDRITIYDPVILLHIYTQKNWKKGLKQIFVYQCSQRYYSEEPKGRNNPNVHQQMNW